MGHFGPKTIFGKNPLLGQLLTLEFLWALFTRAQKMFGLAKKIIGLFWATNGLFGPKKNFWLIPRFRSVINTRISLGSLHASTENVWAGQKNYWADLGCQWAVWAQKKFL